MSFKFLVIHTAAFAPNDIPGDCSVEQIRQWHLERGWSDIGYHFVIRMNGDIEKGRPLSKPGAHAKGLNRKGIGVCCSGHGDLADFTDEQKNAIVELYHRLDDYEIKVIGHREINQYVNKKHHTAKTCPGAKVNMDEIRSLISNSFTRNNSFPDEPLKRLQAFLQAEAFYLGIIDGIDGPKTQQAIERCIERFKP